MIDHLAMVYAADDTLTSTEKHLLGAYCNHTDAHGYCWPGIERLCDETNLSRATVKRANAGLKKKGLIKSVRRINPRTGEPITNLTRVNVSLLASLKRPDRSYNDNLMEAITFEEPTPETPAENPSDLLMAQNEPDPGLKMSPTPAQNEPDHGLNVSPKTSLEPSVEPSSPPSPPHATETDIEPAGREDEESIPETTDGGLERAEAIVDDAVRRWPSLHRAPGPRDRQRLAERVTTELTNGGDENAILDELTRDLADAGSAVRVLLGSRTKSPGWGRPADPRPAANRYEPSGPRPAWCGVCDERTRLVAALAPDGSERMRRCGQCHPDEQATFDNSRVVDDDQGNVDPTVLEQMRTSLGAEQSSDDGDQGGLTPAARAAADSVRQLLTQQQ